MIVKEGVAHARVEPRRTYTVDRTDVGGWHASVYLMEVPGVAFSCDDFRDAVDGDADVRSDAFEAALAEAVDWESWMPKGDKELLTYEEAKMLAVSRILDRYSRRVLGE